MTVGQLIEKLSQCDPNAVVVADYYERDGLGASINHVDVVECGHYCPSYEEFINGWAFDHPSYLSLKGIHADSFVAAVYVGSRNYESYGDDT